MLYFCTKFASQRKEFPILPDSVFRMKRRGCSGCRLRLKCDGTRAETRFRLSAKRLSQFKSAGASVQPTTGSRGVRISGSNAGYTMFRGRVKGTGYLLHLPVSPSLPLPCVTVCHHVSTGLYVCLTLRRLMSYIYGAPILDVSRSHTTTQHSR